MKNKKVVVFFVIAMLLISLFSLNVFALDDNTSQAEIEVSSLSTQPGKSVDVTIAIKNNPGVSAMTFSITYGENITLEKVVFNDTLGGQTGVSETLDSPAVIQWVNAFDVWDEDGVFATLTFSVSDKAEYYSYSSIELEYDPDNVYVSEGTTETNVDLTINNGRIDILPLAGDINDDGKVGSKDVTRLFQYQANWNVSVNKYVIDVNGDKKINSKDITRLFQYLANWDVQIFIDDAPSPHEHEYSDWAYKDETTHSRSCSCGDMQIGEHLWSEGTITEEATTLKEGTITYTCSGCGAKKDEHYSLEADESAFTVIFMDYDNSIIDSQIIEKGGDAVLPANPTRNGYKFTGWSSSHKNIQSDLIIKAKYEINNTYTVVFANKDGSVIKTINNVGAGTSFNQLVGVPEIPKQTGYDAVWDNYFENLQSNLVIKPIYSVKQYKVTFKMPDGSVIDEQMIDYNSFAVAPEHNDYYFKWNDGKNKVLRAYSFSRWDKDFGTITGDTVVTAIYENEFLSPIIAIQYKDINGDINPSITLCNLSDCKLYGLSFTIKYSTDYDSDTFGMSIRNVEFNSDAPWLYKDQTQLFNYDINNKNKEMSFAWSNGNGIQFITYGDFIKSISVGGSGGASALYYKNIKIDESTCSMIVSYDNGETFAKVTPIIIYE